MHFCNVGIRISILYCRIYERTSDGHNADSIKWYEVNDTRVYLESSSVRAEVRNTPYIFEGIYKYIMHAPYGCGALKREPASRLMNFNEAVSSRDRCKGCPDSGLHTRCQTTLSQAASRQFPSSRLRRPYAPGNDLWEMLRSTRWNCSATFFASCELLVLEVSRRKIRNLGCVNESYSVRW